MCQDFGELKLMMLLKKSVDKLRNSIILLFVPTIVSAQIVTGSGQAKIEDYNNVTNACTVAESRAINNALLDNMGIEFEVNKKNFCYDVKEYIYCNHYRDTEHRIAGTLKKIINKREHIWNGYCIVDLKAEVERSRYLNIKVDGKTIYKPGEEIRFNIKVEEPFYLTVLSINNKKVELLFPFNYNINSLIESGAEFPEEGVRYVTFVEKGKKESKEKLVFLFTKHSIELNKTLLNTTSLSDIISEIPVHSRRIFTFDILIKE